MKKILIIITISLTLITTLASVAYAAGGITVPSYSFATPVFGLAVAPDGSLLVADFGAGVVELRKGEGNLIAELPAVSDIAPLGRGAMFAVTGGAQGETPPTARKLFRVSLDESPQEIADLLAFEVNINPDEGVIDSNPYDVEALTGGKALVADAAGNDLLIVDQGGNVDWIATFPSQLVSTSNLKQLVGCPNPTSGFEFVCALPEMIPAEAVPTSIAIGPDGAYYVSELKGFPAPTGMSQIWRIEPGTRHAKCGVSPACTIVASGFTSIVDLTFGPDGNFYIVELDEASWAAVEFRLEGLGGTVNRCDPTTWNCTEVATGLPIPTATAVNRDGTVYVTILALVPGAAEVIALP
jgi:hypothetical protein